MDTIFVAVISVTVIGVVCAALLCIASKFMNVKIDPRVEKLLACMPGVNCGVCGYPGCSGYAEALVSDEGVNSNLCTPGGPAVVEQIAAILGVEAGNIECKIAVVHCGGDRKTHLKKMDYKGVLSCEAAKRLFGGENTCAFGCLGYADCQKVCPNDAVCMRDGLARIVTRFCNGCGLCVSACPNNLISIENAASSVFVLCNSNEKGAIVRKKCVSGCIGCGKCVRECPAQAITIKDNLAVIDYDKCRVDKTSQACGRCVEVCVIKCIQPDCRQ